MKQIKFLLPIVAGVATIFGAGVAKAQQDVYVTDNGDNAVTIIAPGGATSTISSGLLNGPTGIAFDSEGNLFIANNGGPAPGTGDIVEYDPTTKVFSTFATGLANPRGLAFDSNGNLYVANQSSGVITEFSAASVLAGSGAGSTFATGLDFPNGIAIDSVGNLYVAMGNGSNQLVEIAPGGSVSDFNLAGEQPNGPNGIVFGPDGNLYIVNHDAADVEKITLTHVGSTLITGNGLVGPKTLGFDAAGNLYVTDTGNNTVTEYAAGPGGTYTLINTFSSDLDVPQFLAFSPDGLPVPEPGTYALLLAGMAALYFYQRRRIAVPVNESDVLLLG